MRIGLDTGGTYTDAVLVDEAGAVLRSAKSLTTKHDLAIGIGRALAKVLGDDIGPASVHLVSISTTLATNAVVEGQGSPVCLMLIGQRPGALDRARLREALRGDPVVFVEGGHTATGEEQTALDLEAVDRSARQWSRHVSAFAVAGHFAVRNARHEHAARERLRTLTGKPVTCSHELSSQLDAPRRALTSVLNARLVPLIQELIEAVQGKLTTGGIDAPLMVVKGDGSLMNAATALERPIETVLSGPAASLIGARHLSGVDDAMVCDIGGTTTDIAMLRDGRPAVDHRGATVGGWRTMVRAAAVHTVGLGGDSEVTVDDDAGVVVGTRRAVPLSLLATEHPLTVPALDRQLAAGPGPHQGRFAMRLRSPGNEHLTRLEAAIWAMLRDGPLPLTEVLDDPRHERPLDRMRRLGWISVAAFTPSDALHVLARDRRWSAEAARAGARLLLRGGGRPATPEALAEAVVSEVHLRSVHAIASAVVATESGVDVRMDGPLIQRALGKVESVLAARLSLGLPLVALGAPARTYYGPVAERLGTRAVIPGHAGVGNAIGAVAGRVTQTVDILISSPREETYRVHLPDRVIDFDALEAAARVADETAARLARERTRDAGGADVDVVTSRHDSIVRGPGGESIFVESRVQAVASARPRAAAPRP